MASNGNLTVNDMEGMSLGLFYITVSAFTWNTEDFTG